MNRSDYIALVAFFVGCFFAGPIGFVIGAFKREPEPFDDRPVGDVTNVPAGWEKR